MSSDYGTNYMVRFKDGRLWNIYSDHKNNIYYKPLVKDDKWGDEIIIMSQVRNEFGLCVDENQIIHIICLSYKDEILYTYYDGNKWTTITLSQYDSTKYDIRYPSIIELDNRIHIIFAIGNRNNQKKWSLCHYSWNGENWDHKSISQFTIDDGLKPFRYYIYDKDIHLTYHGISGDELKTFHMIYNNNLKTWLPSPDNSSQDNNINNQMLDWINKAQIAYQNQLSMTREADELHRRFREGKRQWELILDELEGFKTYISKQQKKSALKSFFESILH